MRYFSILLLLLLVSCTEKLDFNQADSLQITPVFEGDIFYMDLNSDNLTDSNNQFRAVVQDTLSFGIFEDGKVRDSFEKAEITVGYNNSFQRNFDVKYYFIDENDQAVAQDNFVISAATSGQSITGEETFVFDKTINPDFVNFRKIVVQITITPTTTPVEDKHLHIQTKGKFYTTIILN